MRTVIDLYQCNYYFLNIFKLFCQRFNKLSLNLATCCYLNLHAHIIGNIAYDASRVFGGK